VTVCLDTSVIVALLIDEPSSQQVRAWLRTQDADEVVVGDLAAVEFAASASRWIRTGRIDSAKADYVLASFDILRAQCLPHTHSADDFALAELLVRDFSTKLVAPDALHLASAKNLGAALATLDERLRTAARMKGVELTMPT